MKKINLIGFIVFSSITINLNAQVGIGTERPEASTILELNSDSKALVLPKLTTTEAAVLTEDGLLYYDTTENCVKEVRLNASTECSVFDADVAIESDVLEVAEADKLISTISTSSDVDLASITVPQQTTPNIANIGFSLTRNLVVNSAANRCSPLQFKLIKTVDGTETIINDKIFSIPVMNNSTEKSKIIPLSFRFKDFISIDNTSTQYTIRATRSSTGIKSCTTGNFSTDQLEDIKLEIVTGYQ